VKTSSFTPFLDLIIVDGMVWEPRSAEGLILVEEIPAELLA